MNEMQREMKHQKKIYHGKKKRGNERVEAKNAQKAYTYYVQVNIGAAVRVNKRHDNAFSSRGTENYAI